MIDGVSLGFQPYSKRLAERLIEIINASDLDNGFLSCINDFFTKEAVEGKNAGDRAWWENYKKRRTLEWFKRIDLNTTYGNANVSRFYMTWEDREQSKRYLKKWKAIWQDRSVVVVEGRGTRMGCGNDLLSNAKSLMRIIAPAEDAFSRYDDILAECKKIDKESLILIALGPTATVLSYDLYKLGYQALDVGHLDIEYEHMLRNATERMKIDNKYCNEVGGGREVLEYNDQNYLQSIITKI